jgi:NAD(P)-dependent dehydrogenase (short-subunit alcohol dehydrogenase family)
MAALPELFSLAGRNALVTGAGSGLGRRFAHALAAAGATVVLAARRREKLADTKSSIETAGGNAMCFELDVTDATSVERCFEEIALATGHLDILVNNAGIARTANLADFSESDWDAVIDTNLKGVFLVAQAAARMMIQRGKGGSIINIASILGYRVSKSLGAYIAAKSGVVRLTQGMALEWARYGIRVNSLSPGYFKTEINEEALQSESATVMIKGVPMRRIGNLQELDGPLLLLASDAGSFMTGSNLTVDGGHLCSSL